MVNLTKLTSDFTLSSFTHFFFWIGFFFSFVFLQVPVWYFFFTFFFEKFSTIGLPSICKININKCMNCILY